jgi:hypothetical protein
MEDLMFGFGKNKDLSSDDRKDAFRRAIEAAKTSTEPLPELRQLFSIVRNGASADGKEVSVLVGDMNSYGLPRDVKGQDATVWWLGASKEAQVAALEQALTCV